MHRRAKGFGLVELMVGMFIGLLLALTVYATLILGEANRRTAITSNSAIGNGMASVFMVQTDVKNAGDGMWQNKTLLCNGINIYYAGNVVANADPIAPVTITDGGSDSASDEIAVAQATSIIANIGATVVTQMTSAAGAFKLNSIRAMQVGQLYLAANPSLNQPCTVGKITGLTTQSYGGDVAHAASDWNPANPATTFSNAPAYAAGSEVLYLGDFQWTTYRVRQEKLERWDRIRDTVSVLADNVVLLKAWYGTTNGTTQAIEQWTPATEAWAPPLDSAHAAAIRAVRLAVVTRSQTQEKPSISGGACDATTVAPASWPGGPTLDLSANPKWQCYRYRTLTVVIPLKNMTFGS